MVFVKFMRAAQVVAYNAPYEIETVPVLADLGIHDVLIKIAVASHRHTDFEVARGHWDRQLPYTGSHEGSGTIVAVGSSISHLVPGDGVMGGKLLHTCGSYYDCTGPEANRQYCANMEGYAGVSANGLFAEYVVCDGRHTAKLLRGVSLADASPLACAGQTIWLALKVAKLSRGDSVAIVGCRGGLGHLAVQFAKAIELEVIRIDVRDEALSGIENLDLTLRSMLATAMPPSLMLLKWQTTGMAPARH